MTQSSLLSFAELFSFMLGEAGRPVTRGRVVPPIEPCDMLIVFDKAIKEVELGQKMLNKIPEAQQDPLAICRALVSALHLACLLARLLDEDCEPVIKKQVLKALYDLVSLKVSTSLSNQLQYIRLDILISMVFYSPKQIVIRSGRTALHLACYREAALVGRYPACQFPSPQLVKALLAVGADPNVKDEAGNTALHLAALGPCPPSLAQTLVEHGAHLVSKALQLKIEKKNHDEFVICITN